MLYWVIVVIAEPEINPAQLAEDACTSIKWPAVIDPEIVPESYSDVPAADGRVKLEIVDGDVQLLVLSDVPQSRTAIVGGVTQAEKLA